ncbi:MAG: VOC family protein [Pseudonocardia sp.]
MTMILGMVTIDCADPRRLAEFWIDALGMKISADYGGEYLILEPPGGGLMLGLQRVPEPRAGKNRVHLDFNVGDRAAEVQRLVGRGATMLGEHDMPGQSWTVLADPEGNEFCIGEFTGEAEQTG